MVSPIFGIAVGGNGAHLGDGLVGLGLDRILLHFLDHCFDGALDAALQFHRVRTGGHALHAFAEDALRQNGRGGGAVTGHIGGLGGHFAHHLRAHVLQRIFEFNFFRHSHAIFGDGGSAELLLEDHVAALGTQRYLHRVGQLIDTAKNRLTGILAINNLFCCHILISL